MSNIINQASTIYQYIIKIYYHKFTQVRSKDMVHEPHEGAWGVGEAKWHHKPLIQSMLGLEGGLPLITFFHPHLVIATLEINLWEDIGSTQFVQNVIQPWYGVAVLDCNVVDRPTIHTHAVGSIFLRHQQHWNRTWLKLSLTNPLSIKSRTWFSISLASLGLTL